MFLGFALPIYVQELNLEVSQKGLVMAIASLSAVFGNLFAGYLADRFKTIKKLLVIYIFMYVLGVIILFIDKPQILGFVNVVWIGFFSAPSSYLLENWVLEFSKESKDHFGPVRAFGSLGWALVSFLVGGLYVKYGYNIIPIFYVISLIVYFIVLYTIPDVDKQAVATKTGNKIAFRELKNIFTVRYLILLSSIVLIIATFQVYGNTTIQKFEELAPNDMARYWGYFLALAAFSEIAMFMYSKKLVYKIKASTFMLISAIAMTVAPILVMMIHSPQLLVFMGVFNLFTFAPFVFGSKRLVDDLALPHLRTTTQTTTLAIQTAFVTLGLSINGLIISNYSINTSYMIQIFTSFLASIAIITYRKKYNH
jgi:PPP family 3-phenylpropionic acid transporter